MHSRARNFLIALGGVAVAYLFHPFYVRNFEYFIERRGWDKFLDAAFSSLPNWVASMLDVWIPGPFWNGAFFVLVIWGVLEAFYAWRRGNGKQAIPVVASDQSTTPVVDRVAPSPLVSRVELRALGGRLNWWIDATAARSARNVEISLDLQSTHLNRDLGPVRWTDRRRFVLDIKDVMVAGETFQVPLIGNFEVDGYKFIGWCFRGHRTDRDASLEIEATFTRGRIVFSVEGGSKNYFHFIMLPREKPDDPPMLVGESFFRFSREWSAN